MLFLLPLAARQMGGSKTSHTSSNAGGHPKGFGHRFVCIDRKDVVSTHTNGLAHAQKMGALSELARDEAKLRGCFCCTRAGKSM